MLDTVRRLLQKGGPTVTDGHRGRSPAGGDIPASDLPVLPIRPIGTVQNGIRRPRSTGWHNVESVIAIDPIYQQGLTGIDGFSHLIVVTWLHLAATERRDTLALHPGGDTRLPLLGVFALRVAARPNPIGVTVVRLLRVEGGALSVRGLDAVDGTPVLDLKPYLPPYDSEPAALLPGWALSG